MSGTKIEGIVALVTGANRGIGRALAERLLARGAAKVYAGARDPDDLTDLSEAHGKRVVPLRLDVTDDADVAGAIDAAGDLRLLVNNAGVVQGADLTSEEIVDRARAEMDVNYFAPLDLIRGFVPSISGNGGGAVVNVSSVGGLTAFALAPTYSASKAALHSLTQSARALLAGRRVAFHGVYPGPVDTDMARSFEMEKATPDSVADAILDGVEAGEEDIFPDPFAEAFGSTYAVSPKRSEKEFTVGSVPVAE